MGTKAGNIVNELVKALLIKCTVKMEKQSI